MTIPRYDDVRDTPLRSDASLLARAELLLGHAIRRQVWLLFLDAEQRQLPLLMPSYVPRRPAPGHRENYSRVLAVLLEDAHAHSLAVAYERRGGSDLTAADVEWLALIRAGCAEASIPLRGPLLVHDGGVRWIGPEESAP